MCRYDKTSAESILAHARLLLGKSLRDLHPSLETLYTGKGRLGQCIEKYHFEYTPNSVSEPDFPEAGVELKCTPLKELEDGSMVSKERLVLNIINYLEEAERTFETSSFMRKNALLLLMFYLHQAETPPVDLLFKIIRLWRIPREDLKIFKDDWAIIHQKIASGYAHELSEGDTLYLGACIKGSRGGENKKPQPKSTILADQRAYAIKSSYLNHILVESLSHPEMMAGMTITPERKRRILEKKKRQESAVKSLDEYRQGETFEDLVLRKFRPYIGLSIIEIGQRLRTSFPNSPKAISYSVCRAILGVKGQKVAEFEKAGLRLKTIRLEHTGTLREAMSFQNIKYAQVAQEENWEDSDWHDTIANHRFFFVVFQKQQKGLPQEAKLKGAFFWAMPPKDVDACKSYWEDIQAKVKSGDYDHFMKTGDHPICHVRPKGKDAQDKMETPQGGTAKKYCYWLNRSYVLDIVKAKLPNRE